MGLVLLAGCGANDPATDAGNHDVPGVASATSPGSPPPLTADGRACAGIQAVIAHVAVVTRGMLSTRPFDVAMSRQLATLAQELAKQAPQASDPDIRTDVGEVAGAFTGVARAMRTKDRAKLDGSVTRSRVAYKKLKQVCSLKDVH